MRLRDLIPWNSPFRDMGRYVGYHLLPLCRSRRTPSSSGEQWAPRRCAYLSEIACGVGDGGGAVVGIHAVCQAPNNGTNWAALCLWYSG